MSKDPDFTPAELEALRRAGLEVRQPFGVCRRGGPAVSLEEVDAALLKLTPERAEDLRQLTADERAHLARFGVTVDASGIARSRDGDELRVTVDRLLDRYRLAQQQSAERRAYGRVPNR